MADYCGCTELEPLLDEIRKYFQEAKDRSEPVSLVISNTGQTYPYVLQPQGPPNRQEAYEVAGRALDMLRGGLVTAGVGS